MLHIILPTGTKTISFSVILISIAKSMTCTAPAVHKTCTEGAAIWYPSKILNSMIQSSYFYLFAHVLICTIVRILLPILIKGPDHTLDTSRSSVKTSLLPFTSSLTFLLNLLLAFSLSIFSDSEVVSLHVRSTIMITLLYKSRIEMD